MSFNQFIGTGKLVQHIDILADYRPQISHLFQFNQGMVCRVRLRCKHYL